MYTLNSSLLVTCHSTMNDVDERGKSTRGREREKRETRDKHVGWSRRAAMAVDASDTFLQDC